jgi:hypothetical protein
VGPFPDSFLARQPLAADDVERATASRVVLGVSKRRYDFSPEQLPSVVALIVGGTIASMLSVLNGYKTWQDAGCVHEEGPRKVRRMRGLR